jgi:hypothetical protein
MSEQTHHDPVRLNDEDGEEEVLRRRRGRNGHRTAPSVAQNESRDMGGYDDSTPENCAGDRSNEREVRLIGVFALRVGAAVVRLRLGDTVRAAVLRVPSMHRAGTALGTARHSSFWARHPPGADGSIPGDQGESERENREALHDRNHTSRMVDRTAKCQSVRQRQIGQR